jgi:hypothetical protein
VSLRSYRSGNGDTVDGVDVVAQHQEDIRP